MLILTENIAKSGRNITCDNFFTSISLARKLLSKNLTIVVTLRCDRGELPPDFVNAKNKEPYSTMFGFQEDAIILSYCPKKNKVVPLLSTMHSQPDINYNNKKPEVIMYYNLTKGGVDIMDQMLCNYSVKRRRWPVVIFYNMIDTSALNAYIIWLPLYPTYFARKANKRRQFLIALGKELAGIEKQTQTELPSDNEEPPCKKRRFMCSSSKDRKTKLFAKMSQKYMWGTFSSVLSSICFICVS